MMRWPIGLMLVLALTACEIEAGPNFERMSFEELAEYNQRPTSATNDRMQ
jgi:hypothetical protein